MHPGQQSYAGYGATTSKVCTLATIQLGKICLASYRWKPGRLGRVDPVEMHTLLVSVLPTFQDLDWFDGPPQTTFRIISNAANYKKMNTSEFVCEFWLWVGLTG